MTKTTTNVSDTIIEMNRMAMVLLQAPEGMLNEWEENLLLNFVETYWSEEILRLETNK